MRDCAEVGEVFEEHAFVGCLGKGVLRRDIVRLLLRWMLLCLDVVLGRHFGGILLGASMRLL